MSTNTAYLKFITLFSRYSRRISCPPPLDLPIEVPRMSRFGGLSTSSLDLQDNMNTFKDSIDRRLVGKYIFNNHD